MTEIFQPGQTPPAGSTQASPPETAFPGSNGGGTLTTGGGTGAMDSTKEQVRDVSAEGVEGGKHVASVAADEAKEVAAEAGRQAKALLEQARSELMDHAASQQDRVADQLHTLSRELGSMASKSENDGLATELAQQASRQVGVAAHWLSQREPGSLAGELRSFARAKPGTFLAVAAGIGLLAGRMTRGVQAGPPAKPHTAGELTTSPDQPGITAPAWSSSSPTPTSVPPAVADDYPTGSPDYPGDYPGNDELEKFPVTSNGNTP